MAAPTLDEAMKRLDRALGLLEASVSRRMDAEKRRVGLETELQLMQDDRVVKRGFTMAKECCTMAPYSFKVKSVPPGEYTLVVHDSDPSGGEGFAPWQDTKRVTVLP